jgi:hypothetical protein
MTNHPISLPPKELLSKWDKSWHDIAIPTDPKTYSEYMFGQCAQWGADQELEACCTWLSDHGYIAADPELRAARRPKSPSLKEQALALINSNKLYLDDTAINTIRQALEQLND